MGDEDGEMMRESWNAPFLGLGPGVLTILPLARLGLQPSSWGLQWREWTLGQRYVFEASSPVSYLGRCEDALS